jgi:hypothetical protein
LAIPNGTPVAQCEPLKKIIDQREVQPLAIRADEVAFPGHSLVTQRYPFRPFSSTKARLSV